MCSRTSARAGRHLSAVASGLDTLRLEPKWLPLLPRGALDANNSLWDLLMVYAARSDHRDLNNLTPQVVKHATGAVHRPPAAPAEARMCSWRRALVPRNEVWYFAAEQVPADPQLRNGPGEVPPALCATGVCVCVCCLVSPPGLLRAFAGCVQPCLLECWHRSHAEPVVTIMSASRIAPSWPELRPTAISFQTRRSRLHVERYSVCLARVSHLRQTIAVSSRSGGSARDQHCSIHRSASHVAVGDAWPPTAPRVSRFDWPRCTHTAVPAWGSETFGQMEKGCKHKGVVCIRPPNTTG